MPKKRNEATSKRVASIAGRILRVTKTIVPKSDVWCWEKSGGTYRIRKIGQVEDIEALAAGNLTQAQDKGVTVYKAGRDLSSTLTQAADLAPGKSIRVGRQIRTQKQFDRALKPKRKPAPKGKR